MEAATSSSASARAIAMMSLVCMNSYRAWRTKYVWLIEDSAPQYSYQTGRDRFTYLAAELVVDLELQHQGAAVGLGNVALQIQQGLISG